MECGRRDKEIGRRNQQTSRAKIAAYASVTLRNRLRDAEDASGAKESMEDCLVVGGIAAVVHTFEDLGVGDNTDYQAVEHKRIKQLDRFRATFEVVDYPVGIDQVPRRSTGGRIEILRLS